MSSPYGILTNPALLYPEDGPLPTIRPTQAPQAIAGPGMMPTIRPQFQPNQQRQQREQSIMESLRPRPNPAGFWGKAGRILENIGDAAGTVILGPAKMSAIPGTSENRALNQQGGIRELEALENQDRADQTAFNQNELRQSQGAEAEAKAKQAEAETNKLSNPKKNLQHFAADTGFFSFDPESGQVEPLTFNGQAVQPQGKDDATQVVQSEVGGKPHNELINRRTGEEIRDMGPTGEKPPVVNVNANEREDRAQKTEVLKQYQPALDSAERFNVMAKNYEDAVRDHDQQAMLSLLANHLGMTMGLQKGSRLTRDIIREAEQSRPWMQGMQAKFDKDGFLTGVNLTPQQMRQMVDLGRNRYAEDLQKARASAGYLGVKDDGPARTPSESTINYYIHLAGGDAAKAKSLAQQDGWTISTGK